MFLNTLLRLFRPFFVTRRFGVFYNAEAVPCYGFGGLSIDAVSGKLGELRKRGGVEVEELGSWSGMGEEAGQAGGIAGCKKSLGFDSCEETGCGLHGVVVGDVPPGV